MALSTKTRFLVMNRTNQVIAPRDEMLPGFLPADLKASGDIPKKYSPSFVKEDKARDFAGALASKYEGQRFYVSEVIAGCEAASISWSEATPVTGLADESLAADLEDGSDNE